MTDHTVNLNTDIQLGPLHRIANGVVGHFPMRFSEWSMLVPNFTMGLVLLYQPDMFNTSPSFGHLAALASESTWACIVLTTAIIRLFALGINGTFRTFRYSPHLRMFSAFVSIMFWLFFTLGFLIAALYFGGAWSPMAYAGYLTLELMNFYRSCQDRAKYQSR